MKLVISIETSFNAPRVVTPPPLAAVICDVPSGQVIPPVALLASKVNRSPEVTPRTYNLSSSSQVSLTSFVAFLRLRVGVPAAFPTTLKIEF